jgi:peptide/nickel transport system permease protein
MADAAALPTGDDAPSRGRLREFAARLFEHRPALAALIFLIAAALVVACVPPLLPYAYDEQDFELLGQPTPPSLTHWLGGDELGRDALARIVQGGRVSLAVGLFGALVSTILGTCIGALAGFHRGLVDSLLMRATDVALSIPLLPLVLLISGLLRPSVPLLVCLIGLLTWMGTARLVRAQFLALREREFVEAIRALGAGGPRIMLRHILPNAMSPIIVSATLAVGRAIMLESALSFLGFGVQQPTPSWGNLLNKATPWLANAPWLAIAPGLCIFLTVLSVNFLGDGLRDALEPDS